MLKKSFGDFMNRKKREAVRQLQLIAQMLEQSGFKIQNYLHEQNTDDDPYVFCRSPNKDVSFDGIRIYKIGDQIAFRVQKENKTHPYGRAYPINVEEMYNDFLGDDGMDEKQAAKKVIECISQEIRKFFIKSSEAEKHERDLEFGDAENQGNVAVRATGTDYSALVHTKG